MTTRERGASDRGSSTESELTIFDLLKQDHEKFRYLFDQIGKSGRRDSASLQQLFSQVKEELEVHMEGEERFLYPALEQHREAREKALEGYEEHQVVKILLGTFSGLAADDERWGAKISVLNQMVEHHMLEEERQVFRMARATLNKEQVQQIARQFRQHTREGRKPSRGASVEG